MFLLSGTMVFAQQVFTEKVQETSKNGGVVTIIQDDSLTNVVNYGQTAYGESINFAESDSILIARANNALSKYGAKNSGANKLT